MENNSNNMTSNMRSKSPPPRAAGNTIMMSSNHTAFTGIKTDKVKKNSKGGVLITAEEIESAFKMLDADGSGALTLQALKRRLGILFPELSAKEYRFLMNNKKELQLDDLKGLLLDNEVVNFDPVYEAFRTFDVDGSGVMNSTKLREVFVAFGLGELSDSEIDLLMRATDLDGDGVINLEDFRNMMDSEHPSKK